MLEKTGSIKLTEQELAMIQSGSVPDRIKEQWHLSLIELLEMIQSGAYQVIGKD